LGGNLTASKLKKKKKSGKEKGSGALGRLPHIIKKKTIEQSFFPQGSKKKGAGPDLKKRRRKPVHTLDGELKRGGTPTKKNAEGKRTP